ncbi:hypothetical protein MPC38_06800 [Prescottella equi]|uniref:hypothetical protein n=1 Tax=Rhodococcus hoagii TaxID=43767 RepID=UPI001F5C04BF|nr:hypothetical protein [Prescottella equi]UNQ40954.1 hypothetical protein MPC38_06800 [Prescottella equi]
MAEIKHSGQQSTDTANGKLRFEVGNNRITLFDGTNYRLIFGMLPDNTVGFIISKPGVDVFGLFS